MNDSSPDLSSAPNLSENDSQEKSLPSQAPETPETPETPKTPLAPPPEILT
jgi:hypothetical protein